MTNLDPSLIGAVKGFEGYRARPYWDFKQYTSGYGTRASSPNEVLDPQTAESRLQDELSKAAGHVDKAFPNLPAGPRNALISLTYNAGPGWIQSGLGDLVRSGDLQGAQARLLQYNKAGGQVNPSLVNRRQAEASWFDQPPRPPMQVPNVPLFAPQPQQQATAYAPQSNSIFNFLPPSPSSASGLPLFTPPDRQASEAVDYAALLRGLS